LGFVPLERFSIGKTLDVFPALSVLSFGVHFVEPISCFGKSGPSSLFGGGGGGGGPVDFGGLLSEILEFEFVLTSAGAAMLNFDFSLLALTLVRISLSVFTANGVVRIAVA